jgi:hypothetical protein
VDGPNCPECLIPIVVGPVCECRNCGRFFTHEQVIAFCERQCKDCRPLMFDCLLCNVSKARGYAYERHIWITPLASPAQREEA